MGKRVPQKQEKAFQKEAEKRVRQWKPSLKEGQAENKCHFTRKLSSWEE